MSDLFLGVVGVVAERYEDESTKRIVWTDREAPAVDRVSAEAFLFTDGSLRSVTWLRGGVTSREDSPAQVTMHGEQWTENYFSVGLRHRAEGPAMLAFAPDGSVGAEVFIRGNRWHRLEGPARTVWSPDGSVAEEYFAIEGTDVTAAGLLAYREAVAGGAMHEWALAYALGESG